MYEVVTKKFLTDFNVSTSKSSIRHEMYPNEFAESRRVVISHSFCIAKRFQDWVSLNHLFLQICSFCVVVAAECYVLKRFRPVKIISAELQNFLHDCFLKFITMPINFSVTHYEVLRHEICIQAKIL